MKYIKKFEENNIDFIIGNYVTINQKVGLEHDGLYICADNDPYEAGVILFSTTISDHIKNRAGTIFYISRSCDKKFYGDRYFVTFHNIPDHVKNAIKDIHRTWKGDDLTIGFLYEQLRFATPEEKEKAEIEHDINKYNL